MRSSAFLLISCLASFPAAAQRLPQVVCDKLQKAMVATVELAETQARLNRTIDFNDVEGRVGPETEAALKRLSVSHERLQAAIRSYRASAADAAERLRSCSD